jgi:hypothetical protein
MHVLTSCAADNTMDSSDSESFDSVLYRGETIPVSRTYVDFHDYRDDPDNLPRRVWAQVADLVKGAPVGRIYPKREDAFDALFKLMFPGYGYSAMMLNTPIALYSLEIPKAGEDRFIVYVPRNGSWVLLDDFIWPESKGYIESVEIGVSVRYFDSKHVVLCEHHVGVS